MSLQIKPHSAVDVMWMWILVVYFLFPMALHAAMGTVSFVTVRTRAPSNPNPRIWYRVPCDYRAVPGRTWRTLVIFGGRNCGGSNKVSNTIGWAKWADDHGVFLVAPGFKDDNYWEPQRWSGRALLDALAEIKRSYAINTSKLLYYGYSAGSQASNLFAAWRPDLCRAWVSHACGVFHTPSARMRNVRGLVTCGDADTARDILCRDFVAKARACGQPVIWRSFPNHPQGSAVQDRSCLIGTDIKPFLVFDHGVTHPVNIRQADKDLLSPRRKLRVRAK